MPIVSKLQQQGSDKVYDIADRMSDYTAFEVYAHSEDIPVGFSEELSGNVNKAIPACMEHRFDIKTTVLDIEESDVIVDWGDGETSIVAEGGFLSTTLNEEDGELSIQLSHVYKDPGKYIVKILGRKYYTFNWPDAPTAEGRYHYNLLCRIFDTDLPICSCVTNLASAGSYARRLKKVRIPSYYNFSNVSNFSYLFYASGVESVMGLKNMIGVCAIDSNMFDTCTQLKETDFMFPVLAARGSWAKMFSKCYELTTPVSSMFFSGGFVSGTIINVNNLFQGCAKLPAEDLGHLFWNRPNVTWTNTENAFSGCSDELRARVPVSWGGTNEDLEHQLKFDKMVSAGLIDPNYYSAFEVMPNAEAIAKGSIDTATGLSYNNEVSACTAHKVRILSDVQVFDEVNDHYNDVVIDWGDGTVEAIRDGVYAYDDSPGGYLATHDYAEALAKLGVSSSTFIVKIYGKDYCTFRHNEVKTNNLISRIFDVDLPIAPHITNLASTAIGAKRLLKVQIPFATKYISTASNLASAFEECINLKSVKGFAKSVIRDNCTTTSLFRLAKSLEETDFVFPRNSDSLHTTFYHTYKLKTNIEDHFPKGGFSSSHITLSGTFTSSAVKGTVPAELLWGSGKTWTITTASNEKAFSNAPNVRAQVPVSWGGTNRDIDQQLKFSRWVDAGKISLGYYTGIEVAPNAESIPVGESEFLGGYISKEIPASMTHRLNLRSTVIDYAKSDVVIDWGDGTYTFVEDGEHYSFSANEAENECNAIYEHTYTEQGKYIVKVYGYDYFNISVMPGAITDEHRKYNLISRVMDNDLPIADHVSNLARFAYGSLRLLKVNVPSYYKLPNTENGSGLFGSCENLLTLQGFANRWISVGILKDGLNGCVNLVESDLMVPCINGRGSIKAFYSNCENLETPLEKLFHPAGVCQASLDVGVMFRDCKKAADATDFTKLGDLLWNNKSIKFIGTSNVFTYSNGINYLSAEQKALVPVSWGGTATDTIGAYDAAIQKLTARIVELESKLV